MIHKTVAYRILPYQTILGTLTVELYVKTYIYTIDKFSITTNTFES